MNADEDDDITEELLADSEKLTGLSLELLGLDPHPDDMTAEQRLQFDPEDLAAMATDSPREREQSVRQTRLLAGLLWNSSSILIDQLFRDLGTLHELETVTPEAIAGMSVLSSLPPRFASSYDAKFTQRFIVVAADVTASLARGWTAPGCLAGELAVHCLLDQARITEDIYELDLPEEWRTVVEEVLLEDADSETLYTDGTGEAGTAVEQDLGNLDIRHWFEPFAPGDAVPPYACS
ncbi:hypothetical protein ACFVTE_10460 [Arthrobacter sp. NPDC058097]|uniref:hypothetical protein n=1 Tax=Arthrobacter sp. NPDC058097 TaxID=3346340 RepID=UPI0036D79D06